MKWISIILAGVIGFAMMTIVIFEREAGGEDRMKADEQMGTEVVNRTDKTDRTDTTNKIDKSDRRDTTNKIDKIDRTDRADRMDKVVIPVPFQPQAPFGDWREPWAEACEEATLVLANRFAHNLPSLTQEEMRDEILKLIEYQNERYGDYIDSDAARTAEIGKEVYGISMEAIAVNGVEEVKDILREGNLVIAPMAGRLLHNPYFRQPGPWYHMVVVRGFDEEAQEFITNDVGTRRGEGYRYFYETLWNALHDFPGEKEKIGKGEKRVVIVKSKVSAKGGSPPQADAPREHASGGQSSNVK